MSTEKRKNRRGTVWLYSILQLIIVALVLYSATMISSIIGCSQACLLVSQILIAFVAIGFKIVPDHIVVCSRVKTSEAYKRQR